MISRRTRHKAFRVLTAFLAVGCGSTLAERGQIGTTGPLPEANAITAATPPPPLESPPESGPAPAMLFPKIVDDTLENGLRLRTIRRAGLPLVQLNLVVLSGSETDRDHPGVSRLASSLLKDGGAGNWDGRQLVEYAESLGATLEVRSTHDQTIISLAVTTEHLAAAMNILAEVAQKPRFDEQEFTKLKERERERVSGLAKTSGRWAATMVLQRELFDLPTGSHPYATYDSSPSDIASVSVADCRRWHRTYFVPLNALLVVAGAVAPESINIEAARAFGKWKGQAPEPTSFPEPLPPKSLEIHVVDRPQSTQSEVLVAVLGPERRDAQWAAVDVANQILGGGASGRLFLDLREQRSLAYSTSSSLREFARGPVPIVLSAGTRTEQTLQTVSALLEHVTRLGTEAVSEKELETATRFLSDSILINTETIGALASLSGSLAVLGLPADYYDDYRSTVREVSADIVRREASRYFDRNKAIVIVAGDADRVAPALSRLAAVIVVDPQNGFTVKRRLPFTPGAPASSASD